MNMYYYKYESFEFKGLTCVMVVDLDDFMGKDNIERVFRASTFYCYHCEDYIEHVKNGGSRNKGFYLHHLGELYVDAKEKFFKFFLQMAKDLNISVDIYQVHAVLDSINFYYINQLMNA